MASKMLIGLTGPARSGKDTVGNMLRDGQGFTRVAFADPIRRMVAEVLDVPVDRLYDGPFKDTPVKWLLGRTPRYLMQTVGTEWGREQVDRDLWLKIAMRKVDEGGLVVITDVRFENEADAIRQRGGFIWHIERPDAPKVEAHVSEAGVQRQLFDYVIHNDGDLAKLQRTVDEAFVRAVAL